MSGRIFSANSAVILASHALQNGILSIRINIGPLHLAHIVGLNVGITPPVLNSKRIFYKSKLLTFFQCIKIMTILIKVVTNKVHLVFYWTVGLAVFIL